MDGPVAQLNRVSDYGSEGSRFESWRGHKALHNVQGFLFGRAFKLACKCERTKNLRAKRQKALSKANAEWIIKIILAGSQNQVNPYRYAGKGLLL